MSRSSTSNAKTDKNNGAMWYSCFSVPFPGSIFMDSTNQGWKIFVKQIASIFVHLIM
jgi:hypothetical protein